ncbi:zinc ribbon domain-containing protein [Metallumcola ferriviriculae]|uniref:Zinc ribbon domain-containing protein n=1 Tax=Metallumcola ferriviriculae TaxID=3039180 RepID=A0AAU0UM79_9FIRM|nr:zinc ribbon domain-containing protein [Desulfitibacteraceae bacterium MK1]
MSLEQRFQEEFKCSKCGNLGAHTKKLAMTGTGLSKMFDIQMNKYLFVSCTSCGFSEVYNLRTLEGKSGMDATDIFDVLFGG